MEQIFTEIAEGRQGGVMQAVKNGSVLALVLFVGCINTASLQKKIQGTFYYGYNGGYSSLAYQFTDSTFKTKSYTDLSGYHHIARGTYHIAGDTLLLNYEPIHDPDPSFFKIVERTPVTGGSDRKSTSGDTTGGVQFQVKNKKGEPMGGVNLALLASDQNAIKGYSSDKYGRYPLISGFPARLKQFKFIFIGRKPVFIPADTLRGYQSKIKVVLSDSATFYGKSVDVAKFLIREAGRDKVVLEKLPEKQKIVLERADF